MESIRHHRDFDAVVHQMQKCRHKPDLIKATKASLQIIGHQLWSLDNPYPAWRRNCHVTPETPRYHYEDI